MSGRELDHATPSTTAKVYAFVRIAFALLILATLAWQLDVSITRFHTSAVTFFSDFTSSANILLAVSPRMLRARESSYGLERLRGAAVV